MVTKFNGRTKGKDKNEILAELMEAGVPGSINLEQQKMGIVVRSVEDIESALKNLEESMNKNAASSESLARKVFWLNVVLAAATVVGALLGLYQFFVKGVS